jgi:UrcA family protein
MFAKSSLITVAALAVLGSVTSSRVAIAQEKPGVKVRYADLDLTTAAGAKVMLGRIRMAAKEACGWAPPNNDLAAQPIFRQCVGGATSRAVATLDSPLVTAMNTPEVTPARMAVASTRP